MKKRKPPSPGLAGRKPITADQVAAAGVLGTRTRGSLNRAVLAMLGKGLQDCFDEVRKQEVPERFKMLLRQL
ncbi:MAG TPA: NepR family anti-sigma factor [Xanthobacteraceae bacterium]